ncbi:helix-turn-helix domain-containing protein [Chitinophaga silvisoli]|uniref:AraC family transcriptional regulator n=1 Tax=Chitinophaga silvisoli TaxID=2291814 RepID=A0A3E1P9J0_9BACT|nr:AraC family transcriptional regulator [Chitinophaga silvisoli]RFM36852.1 AraC family transcriptional regulator [Chitinophaga silvisoli]
MKQESPKELMFSLASRIGMPLNMSTAALDRLGLRKIQVIDLLPDMLIMIRSVLAKEDFSFERNPITIIKNGLLISFQNVFDDRGAGTNDGLQHERAHVRISPLHLASTVSFSKEVQLRQITILIDMNFLKQFLGKDEARFHYLFDLERTFWIEEFMSPEIATLVDEVLSVNESILLPDFFYKHKCMGMIYYLFRNLSRRAAISYQQMNVIEIDGIYKVRNAMANSLQQSIPIPQLVKLSGMNEQKLRKLFVQVFGKGLFDYHQHIRILEAARLLKDEKLSVSEVGYRLGFSNLSYFGRLFEKHMGMKPKKWSGKS